mmetsp:Transcript_23463/g.42309  ORF Transcript_23463/g.42309 Transcript_23463/m.42309 type:complete len:89 (-) Transcript_23463:66-332(-)
MDAWMALPKCWVQRHIFPQASCQPQECMCSQEIWSQQYMLIVSSIELRMPMAGLTAPTDVPARTGKIHLSPQEKKKTDLLGNHHSGIL